MRLIISPAPYIKSKRDLKSIMWLFSLALLPPMVSAVYLFGFNALRVMLISLISCLISEYLSLRLRGREVDLFDGSFLLLVGPAGRFWWDQACRLPRWRRRRPARPGERLAGEDGCRSFGCGAGLPDGFVAWRTSTRAQSPEQELAQVLSSILCRFLPAIHS